MSGGGGGQTYGLPQQSNQASLSFNLIPQWLTNASKGGVSAATRLLNNPGQAYTGELAPGLTQDQQNAGQMIRDSYGAYQPAFTQAQGYTDQATGQARDVNAPTFANGLSNIGQYMNPYISNVVDSVSALGQRNLSNSLREIGSDAARSGAFGGSRHGVQEGVATAQNNQNTNNMISQLLSQGYDKASSLMGQDITNNMNAQAQNQSSDQNWLGRMLSAGNQTANIGNTARSANASDISNILNYGSLAQSTQGAQDAARYQEFQRLQNLPYQGLQAYNQTVSSAPHDTTSFTQSNGTQWNPQQQQSSNALMGGLGGAMAGAQMGSAFGPWGTAIGAGAGGLLGLIH